jgi:hypothetical protein
VEEVVELEQETLLVQQDQVEEVQVVQERVDHLEQSTQAVEEVVEDKHFQLLLHNQEVQVVQV